MKKHNAKWMVKVSMLSAVSVVLMLFEFPIPFIAPPFYELDFSEVPVLLGAFALGPLAGVVIELLKILLNLLINGTITAGVGEFANFVIGISFVLPAELIYKRHKSRKNAIIGMAVGGASMVVLGCFINAFIMIPAFGAALKMPMDSFISMGKAIHPSIDSILGLVIFCVAPFNALKAVLVSIIVNFIYKPLSSVIKVK